MNEPLSIERLKALVSAYGAEPERFPADERAAALLLLSSSAEARALLERERELDVVLASADAPELSPTLLRRLNEVPVRFPPATSRTSGWARALTAFGWAAAAAFGVYWGAHSASLEAPTAELEIAPSESATELGDEELENIELALGTVDDLSEEP